MVIPSQDEGADAQRKAYKQLCARTTLVPSVSQVSSLQEANAACASAQEKSISLPVDTTALMADSVTVVEVNDSHDLNTTMVDDNMLRKLIETIHTAFMQRKLCGDSKF